MRSDQDDDKKPAEAKGPPPKPAEPEVPPPPAVSPAAFAELVSIVASLAGQVPGAHQIEGRIARLRAALG